MKPYMHIDDANKLTKQ